MIKELGRRGRRRPRPPPTTPWATASTPPAGPEEALYAYLHTDLLFSKEKDEHARALAQIAQLWRPQLNRPDRAEEALERLKQEYPRSPYRHAAALAATDRGRAQSRSRSSPVRPIGSRLANGSAWRTPTVWPQNRVRSHDRVDHARLAGGLVVDQLRPVGPHRRDLGLDLVGDVDQEARPLDDPEVDAEVIEDPRRVERLAGDVALGELAPEPGVLDELGRRGVVGVGVLPEGGEQEPGPDLAEDGGQGPAVEQGRLQAPVGQAQVPPPGQAEGLRWPRPSPGPGSRASPAGVGSPLVRSRMPTDQPWPIRRTIVPPMPSSASSGWGAITRASSMAGAVSSGFVGAGGQDPWSARPPVGLSWRASAPARSPGLSRLDRDEVPRAVPTPQEEGSPGQDPQVQAVRRRDPQAVVPLQEVQRSPALSRPRRADPPRQIPARPRPRDPGSPGSAPGRPDDRAAIRISAAASRRSRISPAVEVGAIASDRAPGMPDVGQIAPARSGSRRRTSPSSPPSIERPRPGGHARFAARLRTRMVRSDSTRTWQDRRMSGPSDASRASRSRSSRPSGRVARDDLDPAGRASGVAAAAVEDVDPGILDRQDELLPRLDLERLLALDRHGRHASISILGVRVDSNRRSRARPSLTADAADARQAGDAAGDPRSSGVRRCRP